MRPRRAALTALVALALLVGPFSAPAHAATTSATVSVAPRNGGVVAKGDDLTVDVRVQNTGDVALPAGALSFSSSSQPVASTAMLLKDVEDPSAYAQLPGFLLTRTKGRVPALQLGASAEIAVTVPAKDLDTTLTPASGARELAVQYAVPAADRRLTAIGIAAITRMASDARSVGFGTVIPLTAPQNATGVVDVAEQTSLAADGGGWDAALRAARALPGTILAVDPEVLASVRLAGDAAPADAKDLLGDVESLPGSALLPYADGDTTLQRAAGAGGIEPDSFAGTTTSSPASTSGSSAAPSTGTSSSPTASAADLTALDGATAVSWPVPGTVSDQDLAALKGRGPVLLQSSDVKDQSARVAAGPLARIGGARVLIADATLSGLLRRATADDQDGRAATAALVGALAVDAATGATPSVLVVAGRSVDAVGLGRVLRLLGRQSWIEPRGLQDLLAQRNPVTLNLQSRSVPSGLVATARDAVQAEQRVRTLGTAISGATPLIAPRRLALLGLLSAAWRTDETGWRAAEASTVASFDDFTRSVTIVRSTGNALLAGSDGRLRVAVENRLQAPVTVVVHASTNTNKVRFSGSQSVRIQVPAAASNQGVLGYRTIANGTTTVSLDLTTTGGARIGPTQDRVVTVQAGLDTIVAVVLLVALALLLALGVYRNIRRRHAARPLARNSA